MAVRGGLYILAGELEDMVHAMRSNQRVQTTTSSSGWPDSGSPLLAKFFELKELLSTVTDLCEVELCVFLQPFLDVIRSAETTGPTTGAALFSINKFISCNMIDSSSTDISGAVASIADAVTHARFLGTDPSRDEVVLMQILQVLRTLMLAPCGSYLTNESVCEILQSCFRICFETRLSELLRKTSEHTLADMVKLLFSRLPSFKEDSSVQMKKLKMRSSRLTPGAKNKQKKRKDNETLATKSSLKRKEFSSAEDLTSKTANQEQLKDSENKALVSENTDDPLNIESQPSVEGGSNMSSAELKKSLSVPDLAEESKPEDSILDQEEFAMVDITEDESCDQSDSTHDPGADYVNPRGIRFTQEVHHHLYEEDTITLIPHGLPCVREVFRFLVSLINPYDNHNLEHMVQVSLSLLTVALEVASDSIANFTSLLQLTRDELCKHLFSLLNSRRFYLVLPSLRLSFLIFESIRSHLKLQMECYILRIMEIIKSDVLAVDIKEKAVDFLVKMFKVPGFAAELYINYDCDIYCSNLFEDVTKLLSKNAFPVSGLQHYHVLSLDALLALIDTVSIHCQSNFDRVGERVSSTNKIDIPKIKERKKWLESGTEIFNQKPKRGIEELQKHGFLPNPINFSELALHLRENWRLDKKMIGEYISDRKQPEIISQYLNTFNLTNVRIDEALRIFLESFRLPGEAPIISYILEEFSKQWHNANGRPFASDDAVYVLAYAIVMLNTDQHNPQAKRQNVPMTVNDFRHNVRGVNGGKDFDAQMLEDVYNAIKSKEIVIPTEQSGLLKENYVWKQLSMRSNNKSTTSYMHAHDGAYNLDIFTLVWGSTVAALSFVFDKSLEQRVILRSISGFRKCAQIAAYYGSGDVFDNLVISLCKFTTLVNITDDGPELVPYYFGFNAKAQLAAKTMFNLAHNQGDTLREGWKNIVDCLQNLYKCNLLPGSMVEVEDFVEPTGKISLVKDDSRSSRNDNSGLLSSFYSYFAGGDSQVSKGNSIEDQEALQQAKSCILECKPEHLITESKFLQEQSLLEFVKALRFASQGPEARLGEGVFEQDLAVFSLELLIQVAIQNRDRISLIWPQINQHLCDLICEAKTCTFLVQRAVVGLIHLCIRLLRNENVASEIVQSLKILLFIDPKVTQLACRQVAFGLHELIKTNAANIHTASDWLVILALLENSGTGTRFLRFPCLSDSEQFVKVQNSGSLQTRQLLQNTCLGEYVIKDKEKLGVLDVKAFIKSWQSVALIVQDTAHVTPYNLEPCSLIMKTFAEATTARKQKKAAKGDATGRQVNQKRGQVHKSKSTPAIRSEFHPHGPISDEESDEFLAAVSGQMDIVSQLLARIEELHGKAATMLKSWAEEDTSEIVATFSLWSKCWLPLLQALGHLCCDHRRDVRMDGLGRLQRCLLTHEMLCLSSSEWEECFNVVFLPILYKILDDINPNDPTGVDETRMRAANTLSKVFLQRLNTLLGLPNFLELWVEILKCMKKYMNAGNSELLAEAIPESLKNILLVMQTARLFEHQSQFTMTTWRVLDEFLPNLQSEILTTTANVAAVHVSSPQDVPKSPSSPRATSPLTPPESIQASPPNYTPTSNEIAVLPTESPENIGIILQPPLPEKNIETKETENVHVQPVVLPLPLPADENQPNE